MQLEASRHNRDIHAFVEIKFLYAVLYFQGWLIRARLRSRSFYFCVITYPVDMM